MFCTSSAFRSFITVRNSTSVFLMSSSSYRSPANRCAESTPLRAGVIAALVAVPARPLAISRRVSSSSSAGDHVGKLSGSEAVPRGELPASLSVPFDFTSAGGALVGLPAKICFVLSEKDDATCPSFDIAPPVQESVIQEFPCA
jgi:hypothetical protein